MGESNCTATTGFLARWGVVFRGWIRELACPGCGKKIGEEPYRYYQQSVYHSSCADSKEASSSGPTG